MFFQAVLHSGSFGRYLSVSREYRSGCSMMRPCVRDSWYLYREGVVSTWVFVVTSSVIGGCFPLVVDVDVAQGPRCCRWSEGLSSIMLTWVVCVCCKVNFVVVLSAKFACGEPLWSCMVVIAMALYRVLLSFVIVVSCWSSSSRMICGREVGAEGVSGACQSGMR